MPIKENRFTRPKNQKPGGRAFCRIRRAWVCEWSDGKKGYAQYQEVLEGESEAEAIAEAAELSGQVETDVEVE